MRLLFFLTTGVLEGGGSRRNADGSIVHVIMNIRNNLVDDLQYAMAPSTSQMQLMPVTRSPDTSRQSRERFLVNTAICAILISRPQTSTFSAQLDRHRGRSARGEQRTPCGFFPIVVGICRAFVPCLLGGDARDAGSSTTSPVFSPFALASFFFFFFSMVLFSLRSQVCFSAR